MPDQSVTRRDFLKKTGLGATAAAVGLPSMVSGRASPANADRGAVVAAIGDTLIPTDPGDPGYKSLEPYNITAEVLKELESGDDDLSFFNAGAGAVRSGKTFLQLTETERAGYFDAILAGGKFDQQTEERLLRVLRQVRQAVFQVYYKNYPEHAMPRDAKGVPILPADDLHQITNPNTNKLVTGWDVAGFMGPLTWAEEQRRRELLKKIDWKE